MKIRRDTLGDLALEIIYQCCDGKLSNKQPDIMVIEKAELALYFKRALAEGKKRIVIDVVGG